MRQRGKSLPLFIGRRYASLRSRHLLVGFISKLSVIGLALGVAILVTVLSVMNGFDRELRERILGLLPHLSVTTQRSVPLLNLADWEPYIAAVRAQPGVTGVAPQVQLQGMLLANGRSRGIGLAGIVPEREREVSILEDFVGQGGFAALAPGEYNILLGAALADSLAVQPGDEVTLVSTEVPITLLGGFPRKKVFTVAGVFRVGSQLDGSLAVVHMRDAQTLYRLGERIHGIRVQVEDLFSVNLLGERLRALLPRDVQLRTWVSDFGNVYENIRLSKTLVSLLLFLLVAVAAFNVVVSLFMVVRDKAGDIAILRTMGTRTGTIRDIFLVQGFLIGLIGTGVGLLLGLAMALTVTDFVAWLESAFGLALLNAEIYPVDYLPSQVRAGDLLLICGVSLLLSLLATLQPALSAARVKPADALRHE